MKGVRSEAWASSFLVGTGIVGWLAFLLGPFMLLLAPKLFVGPPSLLGLNWVPVAFSIFDVSSQTTAIILVSEYLVFLIVGAIGIVKMRNLRLTTGSRLLLIGGLGALVFYPGISVGPALLTAVGIAGILVARSHARSTTEKNYNLF